MKKITKGRRFRWISGIWTIIREPRRFFSKIVADGNIEEAMMRAFLYGLLGGAIVLGMVMIGGGTMTFQTVFSKLVIIPVLAVALLFVMGGLMMLVSEITGGERDWEIAIKGLASVFFVYPAFLFLNALAWNCWSLSLVSAIIDGYILFLFYNIAVYCMKGRRSYIIAVIAIFALFLITIYATEFRYGWLYLKNHSAALACIA